MHPPRQVRVLCVDDNRDAADTLVLLLQAYGYDATAQYDGPAGLAAVKTFHPDACVLDLNMPGMDGDELAVHIQEQIPNCHIIFVALTAQDGREATERTRRAGFRHHLIKPVGAEQLLAALATLDGGPG